MDLGVDVLNISSQHSQEHPYKVSSRSELIWSSFRLRFEISSNLLIHTRHVVRLHLFRGSSTFELDLVLNLHFNLLSVSQLLEDGFEVCFKKGLSQVLNSQGGLVCRITPFGHVFRDDYSYSLGSSRCLVAGSSSELWKWHSRLGHLSFDLLARLSSLDLIRGLPKLKFEKDLVCHPCRRGKMVAASHPR